MAKQRNEGEGNKTAAREFNQAQQRFAKDGQWKEAAQDAARALSGPEGEELRKAEEKSRRAAEPKGGARSGGTKTASNMKSR